MEIGDGAGAAVVAEDCAAHVLVLVGHFLLRQLDIDFLPERSHVPEALGADGARVVGLGVLGKTLGVHAVAAGHEDDRRGGREQVHSANGTVALQVALNADVVSQRCGHARIAPGAVEVVVS